MAWYFKGFPVGGDVRRRAGHGVERSPSSTRLLATLDPDVPFPVAELGTPRGRQGSPRAKVALPEHWLDDPPAVDLDLADAELGISGG